MHSALLNCRFDESEKTNLYELLAGLLHLGNVRIDTYIIRYISKSTYDYVSFSGALCAAQLWISPI